jgi:hypothetical protein
MRTVVCFREVKQAALYFDRVLPIAFRSMAGTGNDIVTDFPEPVPSRSLVNIVFDKLPQTDAERYSELGRIVDTWGSFANRIHGYRKTCVESSAVDDYEDLHRAYLEDVRDKDDVPIRAHFREFATKLAVGPLSVLLPTGQGSTEALNEDPIATLAGLSLVDVENASWEQIVELRTDLDARRKLQRLRAFLTEKYSGKSRAYLEDDLASRIDDYERASQKHGFDLVSGSISVLLDAQNIQAAAAAGIASSLLGGPWVAVSAAAFVEVGKFAIEFAKRRRTMVDWQASHELAYLIETKRGLT